LHSDLSGRDINGEAAGCATSQRRSRQADSLRASRGRDRAVAGPGIETIRSRDYQPDGSVSEKAMPVNAVELGLVIVKLNAVVSPGPSSCSCESASALVMVGGAATVSVAVAVFPAPALTSET
jgi:hypothetical protein